ncbi:AAA family ATPase [Sphingomonas koreensis]
MLERVLGLRAEFSGAGNRRALFAAFDTLFAPNGRDRPALSGAPRRARGDDSSTGFQLRSLALRNWKVFDRCAIDFPKHDPARPVVLIGGKNGYGKTSLLEAMVMGLFGARALRDVDEALRLTQGGGGRRGAYRRFLERAFHHGARERGEGVMSATLQFDTGAGPLTIERRWYFASDGRLEEDDEELILLVGSDRDVLTVPAGLKANDYYQDEIARRLLAPGLAPFFFFDGEQIKRLGEQQFSEQIRLGIEGILGLATLRGAFEDVRDYLRDRQRETGLVAPGDADIFDQLEAREAAILDRLAGIEAELQPARTARDALIADLGALAGSTFADLQELLEQRKHNELAQAKIRQGLVSVAAHELPLLLVGPDLRLRLRTRLQQEEAAEATLHAHGQDDASLSLLLTAFCAIDPPLEPQLEAQMQRRIRTAWARRPDDRPPLESRHLYLGGKPRRPLLDRLDDAEEVSGNSAGRLTLELASLLRDHATLDALIARKGEHEQRRAELSVSLHAITARIEALENERRSCDRDLGEVRSDLAPLRAAREQRRHQDDAGRPFQQRIERAARLAVLLETVIAELPRAFYGYFADAVTRAYRSLAHKGLISRVEIDVTGGIHLLDGAGRDVHTIDPSAGEGQIFAMAMMAAVAESAGSGLPIVIDTPLGRLDPDHRERILDFFSQRRGQTLLLSQPDEIHGRYLAQIEDRVASAFHLDHRHDDAGPGISTIRDGYLPQVAA